MRERITCNRTASQKLKSGLTSGAGVRTDGLKNEPRQNFFFCWLPVDVYSADMISVKP